jgi:predicted nucleic acid-binding protein
MTGPGMIVIDASVWVARLVPQDVFHLPATQWMAARRQENALFVSPALLLPEVAGAISRRTGSRDLADQAVAALQRLPGLRLIEMEQPLVESAARLAGLLGLRGADAIYVAAAEYLKLPLCTLDAEQSRQAAYQVAILTISG